MATEVKAAGESKREEEDFSEPIMTTQEPHMVIDNNETGINGMQPRRKSSVFGGLALPTKPRRASAAQDGRDVAQEIPKAAAGPASENEGDQVPSHRPSIQSAPARRDSSTVPPPQVPDGEEEGDFARQLRLRAVERKSKLKPLVTPPVVDPVPATEIDVIKTPLKQGVSEEISRRSSISPKADSERRPSLSPKFDPAPTLRRGSDTMPTLELQPNELGTRRSSVPPVDSVAEPLRRTSGTTVPPRRLSSSSSTSVADAPMPIPVQSPDNPSDTAVSTRLSIVDGFAVRRKSTTPTTSIPTVTSPTAPDQELSMKQEQLQSVDPTAVQKPQESPTAPPPPQEQPVVRPATSGQRPLRRGSMTKVKGFSAISVEESFQARKNGVIMASATASGTLATPPPRRTVAEDVQTKPLVEDLNAPRRASVQGEVDKPRKNQSDEQSTALPPRRPSVPPSSSSGDTSRRPSVGAAPPTVTKPSQTGASPTAHLSIADHATTVEGTPVVISSPASSRRSSLASDVAILSSPSAGPLDLPVGAPSSRRSSAVSLEGASPTPSRRGSFAEAQPALTATIAVRPTVVARRRDSNPPLDNINQQEERTTMVAGLGHRRKSSSSSLEENFDAARTSSSGEHKSSSETERQPSRRLSALAGHREDEQKRSGLRDDSFEEGKRSSTDPSREDEEERTPDDQLMQQRRPHLPSSFSLFSASAGSRRMSTASSTTAGGGEETDVQPARRRSSMSLLGSLVRGPKRAAGEEEEEEESQSGPRRQSLARAGEEAAETGEKDQERSSSSTAAMMDEAFLGRKDDSVDSSMSSSSPTKKRLSILGGFRRNSRSSGGESPLAMSATPTEETAFPSMQLASPAEDFVMEITEEERRAFEASQARKDSQALLKQMQAMSAKTTELAGLESELNRIQQEKSVARQATKRALEDNLLEQEDIERQIHALRQKKKTLQLEAADLDGVLAEQELVEKKAAEERELARMALEQAQREKQDVLHNYQDLQLRFPDKIRPISSKDMELLEGGMMMDQDDALLPPRSRRLTFPLPVHSPSPAPPLVLRGLFQLKKDPAMDKIAGASRVSNTTRQVLFAAPGSVSSTTKKAQGEPGRPSRPATIIRRGGADDSFSQIAVAGHNTQPPSLPMPPPRRPSLLNALQTGVSLKKVENPDEKRKSLNRGGAGADAGGGMMAMSRLVKTMSVRREVIEDPDLHEEVTEEEWA